VKTLVFTVCFALPVVFAGCKSKSGAASTAGPQPSLAAGAHVVPAPTAAPSAANQGVELTWTDPPTWRRSPRVVPMRKATYEVPRADKDLEDGECGVFYFGVGMGGTIDANIERWVKQFKDLPADKVKRADRSVNGLVAHTVEVESGSFNANPMGRGGEMLKPNFGLLGAIVEEPSGEYFFKLTAPAATVAKARADFYKMLDSVHVK
jgi:hypothetical protein